MIEKMELYKFNKVLDAAMDSISQKEGKLNTARAALATVEAKSLVDISAT